MRPRPLGDAPAVSGKAPQKVQECTRGGVSATIGFNHEGGEVIAAGLAQGILGYLLCCTHLCIMVADVLQRDAKHRAYVM